MQNTDLESALRQATERHAQAAEERRLLQDHLTIAVEAAQMGTWDLDLTNNFVGPRSPRHDQIFGYATPQATWSPAIAKQYIVEEDQASFDAAVEHAMLTGELTVTVRVRWPDGSLHWIGVRGRFYSDEHGRPVRGLGVNFDITERKHAEETLRASAEKYRILFDSIDEGISLLEMIFDDEGKVVDYWHRENNPAFTQMTGIRNAIGKRMSELLPNLEKVWYERLETVYRTGEPVRVEYPVPQLNQWYTCFLSRIGGEGSPLIAAVYDNITVRKEAELALQASEERQAFLLKLSDALRPLTDPTEVQMAAVKLLGEQLDVMRATYLEVEQDQDSFALTARYERDAAPIPNRMRLSDFAPVMADAYRAGRTLVFRDTEIETQLGSQPEAYRPLQIRAWAAVPLVKNGQLIAIVGVHSKTPRDWTAVEVRLIEEIAERTWAAVERARVEEALHASEARIRIAIEAAQMATWDWHLRTGEIYWNEQHFLLFGMLPRSTPIQPSDFFEHVHPDDMDWVAARLQAAVAERSVFVAEFRCITAAGTQRWISGYGCVTAEVEGQATQMSGVMFDITERKQIEAALLENEARQAIILETMVEGVVSIDPKGHFLSVNAAAESILGVSRTELVGKTVAEPPFRRLALNGEPWSQYPPLAEVAAARNRVFHNDYVIERRDGSRVVISRNITALQTADGTLLGFVSTLSDITEQKRAEVALRDSEARFRAIANLVPDLLWSNDPAGVTDWYNQRWLEYTGQTLDEAMRQGWLVVIHADDRSSTLRHFQRTIEQGTLLRQEQRIRGADGSYRWFLVQVRPMLDPEGHIVRWFGAATDIHEQHILRETLERHVQERTYELATLSTIRQNLLDRLITAQEDERRRIAHDLHDSLGQYLVALNVGLKTIEEIDGCPQTVMGRIGTLRALVLRMDEEVESLAFALRPLALDDLGLADALRRHVDLWTADSQIAVDMHLRGLADARLPAAVETAIFRIVQEALTNIRKYAEATHVSLLIEQRTQEVLTIIEDNGCGFDVERVLAEPEARLHLGLSGMRERADLSGGHLEIESAPGAGTTLYLHIPLRDKEGSPQHE